MKSYFIGLMVVLIASILLSACAGDNGTYSSDDLNSEKLSDVQKVSHAIEDLGQLINSANQMERAQQNTDAFIRRLARAQNSLRAGRTHAASAVLSVEILNVERQKNSGLLTPEQAKTLRTALSHLLSTIPGNSYKRYGDVGISHTDFEQQLPPAQLQKAVSFAKKSAVTVADINNDAKTIITNVAGEIPEVGFLVESLIDIFWPESKENVWDSIEQNVENLVNQKIADYVKKQIDEDLAGLKNNLDDYLEYVHLFATDSSKSVKDSLVEKFNIAVGFFENAEPHFMSQGYELLLLPEFAQFTNLYLALLRDGIFHGNDWGLTDSQITLLKNNYAKLETKYTTYVDTWYNNGLTKATNSAAQQVNSANTACKDKYYSLFGDNTNYYSCLKEVNSLSFTVTNRYVREMTLSVRDYRNMWPALNPITYPNGGSKVKLTRTIFSDPVGYAYDDPFIDPNTENQLLAPITHLTIWGWDRLDAIQVTYGNTQGPRMGDKTGGAPADFSISLTSPLVSATVLSGQILNAVTFSYANGKDTGLQGGKYPGGTQSTHYYGDNQIISYIRIMGQNDFYRSADCMVLGFRFPDSY